VQASLQRRLHYLYLPWSGDDEVLKDISALGDNITAYTPGPEHMGEVFSRFGADPLRDEAVDYALRLMWAGVRTELHVFAGTCHGFDSLSPEWEVSTQLFALQGSALRRAFW
jgi:acetyl esterase/lipase